MSHSDVSRHAKSIHVKYAQLDVRLYVRQRPDNERPIMRRLNSDNGSNLIISKPEIKVFTVYGKKFAYDVNSMDVYEIDGKEIPTAYDYQPNFELFIHKRPMHIVLNVTDACNLNCKYCFVRNYRQKSAKLMSQQIARRAIEMLDSYYNINGGNGFSVSFFGGEPLLAWNLIKEITIALKGVADKYKAACPLGITSNGTLIDKEKFEFIDKNKIGLIISIDGHEEIHNKNRPMKNGNSHKKTIEALKILQDRKGIPEITLRASYTAEGVDLVGLLQYFNELIDQGYGDTISIEPISLNEYGCIVPGSHKIAITEDGVGKFAEEYHKASKWILSEIRSGKRPHFVHYMKLMARLAFQQPSPSECGAGNGYVAIGYDGTIYPCHRQGPAIGHVFDGIDETKRAAWLDNRMAARQGCMDCWLRWFCGGGCRMCSYDRGLDISIPEPVGCKFKEMWFTEIVWLMSELTPMEIMNFCGMFNKSLQPQQRSKILLDSKANKANLEAKKMACECKEKDARR